MCVSAGRSSIAYIYIYIYIYIAIHYFIRHSIIYIPFTIVRYVRIREKCSLRQLFMTSLIYEVVDTYIVMDTVCKMYKCVQSN